MCSLEYWASTGVRISARMGDADGRKRVGMEEMKVCEPGKGMKIDRLERAEIGPSLRSRQQFEV